MRTSDNHGVEITKDFSDAYIEKYKKGQAEHGGQFWRKPTLNFMAEEIMDMWAYYHVHQEHVQQIKKLAFDGIAIAVGDSELLVPLGDNKQKDALLKIYNILEYGNEEGHKEEEKSK